MMCIYLFSQMRVLPRVGDEQLFLTEKLRQKPCQAFLLCENSYRMQGCGRRCYLRRITALVLGCGFCTVTSLGDGASVPFRGPGGGSSLEISRNGLQSALQGNVRSLDLMPRHAGVRGCRSGEKAASRSISVSIVVLAMHHSFRMMVQERVGGEMDGATI